MQKIFLILINLFVILGFSLVVAAQDKTAGKAEAQQIAKIYKQLDAATKKRDLKTYAKYLDKTFTIEQKRGSRVSREETLEMMEKLFTEIPEITEAVTTIEKIRVTDGNYFLETSSIFKGKLKKPNEFDASVIEIRAKSTDVWIKTAKGWKQISQTERDSQMLIDGEPVFVN